MIRLHKISSSVLHIIRREDIYILIKHVKYDKHYTNMWND
jgi:hypothetical protein